jgi:hypothetical protein
LASDEDEGREGRQRFDVLAGMFGMCFLCFKIRTTGVFYDELSIVSLEGEVLVIFQYAFCVVCNRYLFKRLNGFHRR